MRLVVLADTHLRDSSARSLPPEVWAVLGNNDVGLEDRLPVVQELELAGVNVAMVHDSGARSGREARMAKRFPEARLVVFGHSHDPVDGPGQGGQHPFNPGSPTQRRRQPHPSYGEVVLQGGRIERTRVVLL